MDMIKTYIEQNNKHHFITTSIQGDILKVIKNFVEDKDIDIIVMGTKGSSNSMNAFFGSTAIDVMEKVRNCPTLVIPQVSHENLPKEIVFPTSYKTHFKKRELIFLIEIAKRSNAAIRVLHVSEEDELDKNQIEHKKMLENYFEGIEYSFHTLTGVKVQTAVNYFVQSRESDMVTFINKKHAFFGSLLTNPLVKEISYTSKVPILVMHDLRN